MNEYQKSFMKVIENQCSLNQFNVPYEQWFATFKDSNFNMKQLYELFCLGFEEGKKSILSKINIR